MLDDLDLKICRVLQQDGRLSNADLARAIQLIRRSLWLWLAVMWLIGSSLWVLLRI